MIDSFHLIGIAQEFDTLTYVGNEVETPTGIFGVSLQSSIKYANVAISFMDDRGESSVYGYVPIVVAKCGVFLKEKGKYTYEPERLGLSADPFRPPSHRC